MGASVHNVAAGWVDWAQSPPLFRIYDDHQAQGIILSYLSRVIIAKKYDQVYTLGVVDISAERKTAENLKVHMKDKFLELEKAGAVPVGGCTDGSGECKKAKRLLARERPELVLPDCYSHQVTKPLGFHLELLLINMLRSS